MSDLKLIIGNKNYSSWSLRPWIAMKQSGIEFDEELIPFHDMEAFHKEIAEYSGAKCVPVLLHKDAVIWDSLSILEYLADIFPNQNLWPQSLEARGHARSICAEMHSGFSALRDALPMNLRRPLEKYPLSQDVQADVARITYIWREARQKFGNGGVFLYGAFSNADAMYAPIVSRFHTYGVGVDDDIRSYMDAVLATSAFQEWQAEGLKETWIVKEDEV